MNPVRLAIIGTLDTKGPEIAYAASFARALGASPIVIDVGILGEPGSVADVTRQTVAAAAGSNLEEIAAIGTRAGAVEAMAEGLREVCLQLFASREADAFVCFGGAEGALMGAHAMQALPLGVPKVVVSPAASGRRAFGPFIGSADIMVMHSVIDIQGINAVSKVIYENAIAAAIGVRRYAGRAVESDRPLVGVTMLGQTTPGAMAMCAELESAGFEPVVFHANGIGGPAMETLIRQGALAGVVDYALSEIANSLFDGVHAVEVPRLVAAIEAGIPMIVVPGATDFFNQHAFDTVPDRYRSRQLYRHNPVATLVRVEAVEMARIGEQIAERVLPHTAPVEVIVPTGGLSLIGVPGGPIADRDADLALLASLRAHLPEDVPLIESALDVNSAVFGQLVAERFIAAFASHSSLQAT